MVSTKFWLKINVKLTFHLFQVFHSSGHPNPPPPLLDGHDLQDGPIYHGQLIFKTINIHFKVYSLFKDSVDHHYLSTKLIFTSKRFSSYKKLSVDNNLKHSVDNHF